jgi:CRISPR-associated protein Csb2
VNEGLIEWPPSPWRLLRAFLATGYTKLGWPNDGPPPPARDLIAKLAAVLPRYRLPAAVGAHSRHYMPMARFKNGREETTMVLDTWAQVDDGTIGVRWDIDLEPSEREVFHTIASDLAYLGRSESWVDGRIEDDEHGSPSPFDVRPADHKERPGLRWEQVSLLAAIPADDYQDWRRSCVQRALDAIPPTDAKGKPLTKSKRGTLISEIEAAFPGDTLACLQVDTAWLEKHGWNQPPGTRKVLYWRPSDSLQGSGPRSASRLMNPKPVDFMLLSMATASGNLHALPTVTRTLPQGELLHRALLSRAMKGEAPPMVLSGRGVDGVPLRGERPHAHAHLLHVDLDEDGHLDHVLIWAPMGLDAIAQRNVRAVRETFTKRMVDPLRLALVAAGSRSDLLAIPPPWGKRLHKLVGGSTKGSRHWRSVTPFVPPRFTKPRGRNTLEAQIATELVTRGAPEPASITIVDPHADNPLVRKCRHFVRRRGLQPGHGAHAPPPIDCGFVVELMFPEPVLGPLAIGYGCHFGLGVFEAVEEEN